LYIDICIGRISRQINFSHLNGEVFAAVVICHDVSITCAKLGPKIRTAPACLAHHSYLIPCLTSPGIEPGITVEPDMKAFATSIQLKVDEFCRCSAVLEINDPHQGFTEGILVGEVQHFSFLSIPSKLPTLRRVVAHLSCFGLVTVSHHTTLIGVLVGSFASVIQSQIVANFVNLSRRVLAPLVIESS
jgi:hypothetical protein